MTAAILTSGVGTFARLVEDGQVGKVTLAIEEAIEKSFISHPMRHLTSAEVRHRFDMCAAIFVKLRADLKWGIERANAHLSEYLTAELNGTAWTPDERACWMPSDGHQ